MMTVLKDMKVVETIWGKEEDNKEGEKSMQKSVCCQSSLH
jgi:hypothetical protein